MQRGAAHGFNGPAVGYLRELRGIDRKNLATALGWSLSHLTNIENGKSDLTESKAREVATLFGIADLRVLYGPLDRCADRDPVFPQGMNR